MLNEEIQNNNRKNSGSLTNRSYAKENTLSKHDENISTLLGNNEYIEGVACGTLHTLLRSNIGRIFSAGYGETFALGIENPPSA